MAKSKIIHVLVNGEMDIMVSLKRLKVLLQNFDKPEFTNWINNELNGYESVENEEIPPYRKINGRVKGNFFVGNMQYTNTLIPLTALSLEERQLFEERYSKESIAAISDSLKTENKTFCFPIPDVAYGLLCISSNIKSVHSAYLEFSRSAFVDLITIVENKVLDILLLLENEFGVLDDLDIEVMSKSPEEVSSIEHKIIKIIFDNSVTIGSDNVIKNTKINSSGEY